MFVFGIKLRLFQYAIDDNDAEKAQHVRNSTTAAKDRLQSPPPETNPITSGKPKKKPKTPEPFRADAKIWQVYLQEAEEKAKEQADSWNTGLDSLLIFVRAPSSFNMRN